MQTLICEQNVDVRMLSAFKTNAVAQYFAEITSEKQAGELALLVQQMQERGLPVVYVGGGTNCLFAFDSFPGLIVKNSLKGKAMSPDSRYLVAMSAELVSPISTDLFKNHEIRTLLPWVGLPGTIGGAVVGNAGCFGLSTSDILVSARILNTSTGEIRDWENKELAYEYRNSRLKSERNLFVLSATFDLTYNDTENPYTQWTPEDMQKSRREKQPPGLSCGSYFANPEWLSAGQLIDRAGLKWKIEWGMKISEQHGNFFVNVSHATWQDVLALAEIAKTKVRETFNVELHEEVRIIRP